MELRIFTEPQQGADYQVYGGAPGDHPNARRAACLPATLAAR